MRFNFSVLVAAFAAIHGVLAMPTLQTQQVSLILSSRATLKPSVLLSVSQVHYFLEILVNLNVYRLV